MLQDQFFYKPLGHFGGHICIRLLSLQAAKSTNVPLFGELVDYPLHSAEENAFEALSYTWGNIGPSQSIILGGRTFRIGQNLFEALQRLRFTDGPRLLWIDALCINQADAVEKSRQVPLMGQIYATARQVIVWLGDGSSPENDSNAYDLFLWASPHRTLHPWRKVSGPWSLPPLSSILHIFNDIRARDSSNTLSATPDVTLDDIEQLLARPWFLRRWIVQELCNAREVVLLFGCYQLSWLDFSGALDTLSMAPEDSKPLQKSSAISLMIWRRGVLDESVLKTMEAFCGFKGSDDRDRIAAFLTLGWPQTFQGSDFVVDYTRSVDENYYRLAIHMVDIGKGAELLLSASNCIRDIEPDQNSLPSWVPDWRTITQRKLRSRLYGTFDVKILHGKYLEFIGQIRYILNADAKRTTASSNLTNKSQWEILPKKGDMICRLVAKDGKLDVNSIILRRHEQSDHYFFLIGNPMFYNLPDADWGSCLSKPEHAEESQQFLLI